MPEERDVSSSTSAPRHARNLNPFNYSSTPPNMSSTHWRWTHLFSPNTAPKEIYTTNASNKRKLYTSGPFWKSIVEPASSGRYGVLTTDTGVVVLQRDLFSGAESLRLTTAGSELGGHQARALASAYEVAHRPPQPLRTEDDSLVSHAGVEESSMGYGGGSA